jgi:hypothetical protein
MRSINKLLNLQPTYSPPTALFGVAIFSPSMLGDLQPANRQAKKKGPALESSDRAPTRLGGQRELLNRKVLRTGETFAFNGYQFQQPYALLPKIGDTYMYANTNTNMPHATIPSHCTTQYLGPGVEIKKKKKFADRWCLSTARSRPRGPPSRVQATAKLIQMHNHKPFSSNCQLRNRRYYRNIQNDRFRNQIRNDIHLLPGVKFSSRRPLCIVVCRINGPCIVDSS